MVLISQVLQLMVRAEFPLTTIMTTYSRNYILLVNSSSSDDYFIVYSGDNGNTFELLTEFYQIDGNEFDSGFGGISIPR